MNDLWFEKYARFTPFGIVGAVVLGYLIAGGVWWGIPVVAVIALIYAAIRVKIARRIVTRLNRRFG